MQRAMEHHHRVRSALSRFAQITTATVGSGIAAAVAIGLVGVWLMVGFVSGFTEHWHRVGAARPGRRRGQLIGSRPDG
jgi:hypothetical protein